MCVESKEIFDLLAYIAAQRRAVTLVTNFRGVPLEIMAYLIRRASAAGRVRLYARQRQVVALQPAALILLQSDLLARPVMARVGGLDLQRQTLTLTELAYAHGSIGQRRHPRVQPEHPLSAEINVADGFRIKGRVIDLSLDGLSLQIAPDLLPVEQVFAPGSQLQVSFGLPGPDGSPQDGSPQDGSPQDGAIIDLCIPAQVAYALPPAPGSGTRLGLFTSPSDPAQHLLRRYIFDRQTAILAEVQSLNQTLIAG